MKKLLLILLCLPLMTLAQKTYVPDDNFENFLENNGMGDLIALNDSVFTSNINSATYPCVYNQLTSLDVSNNTALTDLTCVYNQLTTLDVSNNNTALNFLGCGNNYLTSLNLKNINYFTFQLNSLTSPALICIEVSDSTVATNALSSFPSAVDSWSHFSEDCNYVTGIEEHTTNKELLRTIDVLGRETTNNPIFYIYDDGTVEKRIVIE